MKTKRIKYYVRWDKTIHEWFIGTDNNKAASIPWYIRKQRAVKDACSLARVQWREFGVLSQVVIFKKNGQIQTEYTYGKDPKRYKG